MKYFKKFLEFFKELYTPPAGKENLYTYRLTLFTILAGVVALFFAYVQIKTAFSTLEINQKQLNTQLEELNAKAKIELKVHVVQSAISIGPEITEPIYITIVPRNNGNYNTPTWAAGIIFCSKIAIKESDPNWTKIDHQMFYYKSNNKVLSEQEQTNMLAYFNLNSTWEIKYEPYIINNDLTLPDTKGCFPASK